MRILIANSFYAPDVVGGAELSVQGIAEQMAYLGHEVYLLTTGKRDEDVILNGVMVARRRFAGLMPYGVHRDSKTTPKKVLNKPLTIDNPFNGRVIREVLALAKPDAILSNNLLGITPELWRRARAREIPIMHTVRDYALLCPNSTLICSRRPSCGGNPLASCKVIRSHQRRRCKLVDTVAAPSHYALSVFDDAGFFADARHTVIPNAVRFDAHKVEDVIHLRKQTSRPGPLRVAYLGRLTEEKGVGDLFGAMEGFGQDEVELHLAGQGPLEEEARRLCAMGQPLVLHGFLDQTGVDELLTSCDVLVAPSRYAETFGRVVLDAYRNAMPAIVSDAGALPEVLREGTGVVVPAGDAQALHEAIGSYFGARERLVAEGILGATALGEYTVEHQTQGFLRELEELIG